MCQDIYQCPYCDHVLSSEDGRMIELTGWMHCPEFSFKTTFQMLAKLGQYGSIIGENVQLREHAKVEFECLSIDCRRNFTSPSHRDLSEIKLVSGDDSSLVVFCKEYGKYATFLLDAETRELKGAYGIDADEYVASFQKEESATPPEEEPTTTSIDTKDDAEDILEKVS